GEPPSAQPAGQQRDAQMRQLSQQKDQLRNGVAQLEQQLDTQGRQALSGGERESARKLQEAAGTIRSRQVKEIIDYSKQLMSTPDADRAETRVSQDLETV